MIRTPYQVRLDIITKERFEKLSKELGYESMAQHIRALIRREILKKKD